MSEQISPISPATPVKLIKKEKEKLKDKEKRGLGGLLRFGKRKGKGDVTDNDTVNEEGNLYEKENEEEDVQRDNDDDAEYQFSDERRNDEGTQDQHERHASLQSVLERELTPEREPEVTGDFKGIFDPVPLVDEPNDAETEEENGEADQGDTNDIEPALIPIPENVNENEDDDATSESCLVKVEGEREEVDANAGDTRKKFVFAHFMVGNTYPYTIDDWYADIKLAAANGIDGFVLNVGREDWQKQRVMDCFAASKRLPDSTYFKFFFSFDMTSIPGSSPSDINHLVAYLSSSYYHPRMFHHPRTNGVVVSTFSGENCTFSKGSMESGWAWVKRELSQIGPVYFIPAFFVNPVRYIGFDAMDGAFNWNGGWPIDLTPSAGLSKVVNPILDSDQHHLENLKDGRTFMAAVSPWFFTHYGPDSWNKNWIYRADDHLFVRRWEQLISMRDNIDIAQVISWNDYGESHYIGAIRGAQPNSQSWVDGYPHDAWLAVNQYYAKAFQTGTYPKVEKDQIYMWARPHPRDAVARGDSVGRPRGWELTDDLAWLLVFTTSPGTIQFYTSESTSSKLTASVKAGVTKLSFPLQVDGGMRAELVRDGETVVMCNPMGYRFEGRPGVWNYNAYVCCSP